MFAIVRVGNQQFKVKAGDFIRAPYQDQLAKTYIKLDVLAFGDDTNLVYDKKELEKSMVKGLLTRQTLSKKIIVFKKKRRKGYRRTQGHRQKITEIKIVELQDSTGKVSKVELKQIKASKPVAEKQASSSKPVVKKQQAKTTSVNKKIQASHKQIKKQAIRKQKNIEKLQDKLGDNKK